MRHLVRKQISQAIVALSTSRPSFLSWSVPHGRALPSGQEPFCCSWENECSAGYCFRLSVLEHTLMKVLKLHALTCGIYFFVTWLVWVCEWKWRHNWHMRLVALSILIKKHDPLLKSRYGPVWSDLATLLLVLSVRDVLCFKPDVVCFLSSTFYIVWLVTKCF